LPRAAAEEKPDAAAQKPDAEKHVTAAKQAAHTKVTKGLHFLVADDAELNRELVIELLERRGYSAVGVSDGKKALAALDHDHFDAVLMDEEMPHMTGVEATRAIREREKGGTKHQFIIGITGNATFEDERRLLEAGMDAFLTKPIHMQKLYQTVELAAHKSTAPAADASPEVPVGSFTPRAPVLAPNLIVGAVAPPAGPEPRAAQPAPPDLRAHLLQITGGNEKLARSLVKTFLADAPKTLAQIRKAVVQKNGRKLGGAAHLLKGSIAIFGATKAVAAAQSLQTMGRSGHIRKAAAALRALESEFKSLDRELRALYQADLRKKSAPRRQNAAAVRAQKSKSRKKR
jgi:CheY-like chemotaxis protein/HPt (histidine-containing phosphotransfer) domain-containing protein